MTLTSSRPQITTPRATTPCSFLVIGYGNELRGDDAVGPTVAAAVASWHLPSVRTLSVQQLVPELADELAQADYVIFVDACSQSCTRSIQIEPIVMGALSSEDQFTGSHVYDPWTLLKLTESLHGYHPQAWLLQVPIECFALGEQLSPTAQHGCDRVLRAIEQFFMTYRQPVCMSPEASHA
ncbi:MAG: hydrogenase maturation protease [Cyanobacteria bacterium J06554_6]